MGRALGWIEEVVEGTSPIVVGTAVTSFGNEQKYKHPWHDNPLSPNFSNQQLYAVDLLLGRNNLDFDIEYDYVHGWMWKYLLGTPTNPSGSIYRFIKGTPGAIKSRTIYSEVDGDYVEATGCKIKQAEIAFALDKYIKVTENIWGWESATRTQITASPNPTRSTGLLANITSAAPKGYIDIGTQTYNAVAQNPLLQSAIITISKNLKVHGGMGSAVPTEIEELPGCSIIVKFLARLKIGTANQLIDKARAAFSVGASNNLVLKVHYNSAGTKYDQITLHNVRITGAAPEVKIDDAIYYGCVGTPYSDGTNEIITVDCDDGIDYIP